MKDETTDEESPWHKAQRAGVRRYWARKRDALANVQRGYTVVPIVATEAIIQAINVARSITRADDDAECVGIWTAALRAASQSTDTPQAVQSEDASSG